jgi:hypothetical protein
MTLHLDPTTMAVCLKATTVSRLFALRQHPGESVDTVVARLVALSDIPTQNEGTKGHTENRVMSIERSPLRNARYSAVLLGEVVSADSLGGLFGELVDLIDNYFPDVVARLAERKARTRRYVAKTREAIHGGRRDLPTIRTRSGWWVSANIGREDLDRALSAVCAVTGLEMGRDIRMVT